MTALTVATTLYGEQANKIGEKLGISKGSVDINTKVYFHFRDGEGRAVIGVKFDI